MASKSVEETYLNLQENIAQLCKETQISASMKLVMLNRIYTASEKLLGNSGFETLSALPFPRKGPKRIMIQLANGIESCKEQDKLDPEFLGFLNEDLLQAVLEIHGPALRTSSLVS